jgi:TolA-binding protein
VSLNELDEAEAVYRLSDERHLPYQGRPKSLYLLAFLKGEQARMAQLAASVTGKPSAEAAMLGAQADTEAWYGRMKAARVFTQRSMDAALNNDATETAAGHQAAAALFEAESGKSEQSRIDANAAMKLAPNRDVRLTAALALAQAGDIASAERLMAGLDKDFPLDTLVQKYWLPVIRAATALQRKDPNRTIEVLEAARVLDFVNGSNIMNPSLLTAYVRGEAFLMLQDGSRAAAEFQKFIGLVRNAPIAMLARFGLARAYAMQGDITKARTVYQVFLTAWKDADADLPVLQQAKAEYAKL